MPKPYPITLIRFSLAYIPWAILVSAALLAPELSQNLDRYRTIYTIWATTVLLIPALCFSVFARDSEEARSYWLLLWTFSYFAFLFHFYWAVFIIFKGPRGVFEGQGPLFASANFLLTAWWGLDVFLAWIRIRPALWLRVERIGAHLFVFVVFSVTLLLLRGSIVTRALGGLLTVSVIGTILLRLIFAPPADPKKCKSHVASR